MTTKPCPQCGTAVPLHARFCGQCGHTFSPTTVDEGAAQPQAAAPVPPAPASSPRVGMGTLFGHAALTAPAAPPGPAAPPPQAAQAVPPAPSSSRAALNKTMALGGAGLAAPSATPGPTPGEVAPAATAAIPPPPASAPTLRPYGSDKQTMLGVPAVGLPPPPQAPPPPVDAPAQPAFAPATKTMLGVAIPGIAPTHDEPAPRAQNQRAGTLLGIAAPGIAPLHPGAPPPHGHAGYGALPPPEDVPPIVPAPAPLVMEPLPEAPRRPNKQQGVPAIAVVAIVFALVAVASVGAVLFVLKRPGALSAQPYLDDSGKEALKIQCPSCPDGTIIALGAATAKTEASATLLPLPAPLSIGENDLEMKIDRPGTGRDETVKVHVPVAYRVKTDLSALTASPPSVVVVVDAAPGTEVAVDGKPVALTGGRGTHPIDIASELEGPSDDQKTIDRKIPFTVKPKGASAPESGQLTLRVSVAPLHLDAPGLELYTERATGNIAGQVKPNSTLTVDGQTVAVDPQGRFGVRVDLPANGEKALTVVGRTPPLAPRTVHAKIIRVPSLAAAAKTLDAKAPITFDAYAADPKQKVGALVVIDGEIQDIRVLQGQTVMAVEEKKACSRGANAPCVVRVVHGEEVKAARGDHVRAYGRVTGPATLNGAAIPNVEGMLVIAGKAARK